MSRNLRQKYPASVVPKASTSASRRRSSRVAPDSLSDDEDGYSAVDDVSDSEDDDEGAVYAAEEEHMINQAMRKRGAGSSTRPESPEEEEEDEDADEEEDGDADQSQESSENDAFGDSEDNDEGDDEGDDESLHVPLPKTDWETKVTAPVERHVRFNVPSSDSDSDSTDTDEDCNDIFPDLFVSQNDLAPSFRRRVESDPSLTVGDLIWNQYLGPNPCLSPVDAETLEFFQASDQDTPVATPHASAPTPIATAASDESEYDSDGETTEEEEMPARIPRPAAARDSQSSDQQDESSDSDFKGGALVGFRRDDSDRKPVVRVNSLTRKIMIFTPQRSRHLDLSPEQFQISFGLPSDFSPIVNGVDSPVMMGGSQLFHSPTQTNFELIVPDNIFDAMIRDTSESDVDGLSDDEQKLDIRDFIHIAAEEEASDNGDAASEGNAPSSSEETPEEPGASDPARFLQHLEKKSVSVSAFRRTHTSSTRRTAEKSMAFSRIADGGATPLMRTASKRKSTPEQYISHKKQRSISEIGNIRF